MDRTGGMSAVFPLVPLSLPLSKAKLKVLSDFDLPTYDLNQIILNKIISQLQRHSIALQVSFSSTWRHCGGDNSRV